MVAIQLLQTHAVMMHVHLTKSTNSIHNSINYIILSIEISPFHQKTEVKGIRDIKLISLCKLNISDVKFIRNYLQLLIY